MDITASCGRAVKEESEYSTVIDVIGKDIEKALSVSSGELSKDIQQKEEKPVSMPLSVKKRRGLVYFPPPANLNISEDIDVNSLGEGKLNGFMSGFTRPSLLSDCGDSPIYFVDQNDESDCLLDQDVQLNAVTKEGEKPLSSQKLEPKMEPVLKTAVKPEIGERIDETKAVSSTPIDLPKGVYLPDYPDFPENLND